MYQAIIIPVSHPIRMHPREQGTMNKKTPRVSCWRKKTIHPPIQFRSWSVYIYTCVYIYTHVLEVEGLRPCNWETVSFRACERARLGEAVWASERRFHPA